MVESEVKGAPLEVPLQHRVELLHGYVQLVANAANADILLIKGAAIHPDLLAQARVSMDVDVLVRPSHVDQLIRALKDLSWEKLTGFDEGSAFGHAINLRHNLGLIDLHRSWPGFEITSERAFSLLWDRRGTMSIAGVDCSVPSLDDQRLILLLHFARSGGARCDDRDITWTNATPEGKEKVSALAREFHAELALAAATGQLDQFRDERGYFLWRYFSLGSGGRLEEWRGRFFAAPDIRSKIAVLGAFVRVNNDLLTAEIGHKPQRSDYISAYFERIQTASAEFRSLLKRERQP